MSSYSKLVMNSHNYNRDISSYNISNYYNRNLSNYNISNYNLINPSNYNKRKNTKVSYYNRRNRHNKNNTISVNYNPDINYKRVNNTNQKKINDNKRKNNDLILRNYIRDNSLITTFKTLLPDGTFGNFVVYCNNKNLIDDITLFMFILNVKKIDRTNFKKIQKGLSIILNILNHINKIVVKNPNKYHSNELTIKKVNGKVPNSSKNNNKVPVITKKLINLDYTKKICRLFNLFIINVKDCHNKIKFNID